MGFENYFQSSAYFFHVWAADFKKIALQKKAALTTHCTLYDAREIICCRTLIHAVLVFVFGFFFSWDICYGPSGWFFSCKIQSDHRLLRYVGLQAKNIHYFWSMIITVQNRLFFHDLLRFCPFSNKLILSLLWHLYSLVLFWCVLYTYHI